MPHRSHRHEHQNNHHHKRYEYESDSGSESEDSQTPRRQNIAFVHPNLGIGGAERLIVDAALSLQQRGHRVVIYTMHHDISHCFEETRDGTLEVRVAGNWIVPQSIRGRFQIMCTTLRSLFLARAILADPRQFDAIFIDQLSAPIPLLKFSHAHIFFYCHFPDKLLTERTTLAKKLYRLPFDLLEEFSTNEANEVFVNSRFTQEMFIKNFSLIHRIPKVLYPAINKESYDKEVDKMDRALDYLSLYSDRDVVLSVNRFERKKNLALAIDAFIDARSQLAARSAPSTPMSNSVLVLAGGWDPLVAENIQYLKELHKHAIESGLNPLTIAPKGVDKRALKKLLPSGTIPTPTQLDDKPEASSDLANADIIFLPSFTENQRTYLYSVAKCVLYTPANEHLGIVPLEAMYKRIPVIAVNSGGPRETVVHAKTGYLCEQDSEEFAKALVRVFSLDKEKRAEMGELGHKRVNELFTLDAFANKFEEAMMKAFETPPGYSVVVGVLFTLFIIFVSITLTLVNL